MQPLFHQTPVDLERWRGRHLRIAAIAFTVPIMEMHLRIAALYQERIAAFIHYGGCWRVAEEPPNRLSTTTPGSLSAPGASPRATRRSA